MPLRRQADPKGMLESSVSTGGDERASLVCKRNAVEAEYNTIVLKAVIARHAKHRQSET